MKSKFAMDQDVILTEVCVQDMVDFLKTPNTRKRFSGVQKIHQIYEELEDPKIVRYRYQISGLWFDEPDLMAINKQDDPEYYL